MKKTILSFLILAASFTAMSQDKDKLICDETTLTDMKSGIKIETENDAVFNRIVKEFEGKLTRYMVTMKKDRKGQYKSYVLYFKTEDKPAIVAVVSKY